MGKNRGEFTRFFHYTASEKKSKADRGRIFGKVAEKFYDYFRGNYVKWLKFSIFIDEKIYSVNRLKKTYKEHLSNGITYFQVWQNRKKTVW